MDLKPRRFDRLPPLRSLAVFEAAARLGRFASAADELGMTQAGVSQHIAQLETGIGSPLFLRQHRGVTLTPVGTTFLDTVVQGLSTLAQGVSAARRRGGDRAIHILTDFGFAAWWLMPRIAQLSDLVPGIEIRLVTSQSDVEAQAGDFDLAILFGDGEWAGCRSTLLFPEEVYPVCAPGYLADRSSPTPAALGDMRLLHLRHVGRQRWFGWTDWFARNGVATRVAREDLTFNNYQLVLQAAMLGQGVAMGWAPLIDDLVVAGHLVRLATEPLRSGRGYHIVQRASGTADAATQKLVDWLSKPGARIPNYPPAPARDSRRLLAA